MDFKPRAVLPDEVYQHIDLCWFCCAKVLDKKQTQTIIHELGCIYSLENFTHLKRAGIIKNSDDLHVLITPVSSFEDNLTEISHTIDSISSFIGPLFVVEVPKQKPLTRQQFLESKNFWSCSFHEDKRLEKAISNDVFTKDELQRFAGFMQLAVEEMQKAKELGIVNPVGAVVVSGEVIALGHTKPDHPLKHAVMESINNVACAQNRGSQLLSSDLQQSPIDDSISSCPKKAKLQEYLCVGYDIFTTVEPCIMCSMALVHSRISRVFFKESDPTSGGLGSKYKIHCNPLINHHFEVYQC